MNEQDILNSLLSEEAPKQKNEQDILSELLGGAETPQETSQPTARAYSKKTRKAISNEELDTRNKANQEQSQRVNQEINFAAYQKHKAELAAQAEEKLRQQNEIQRQAQRTGSFTPAPTLPKEYAEQNLSEREFARQQLEQRTGRQINREGFENALAEFSEKTAQATQNIPLMPEAAQLLGNLVAGTGQTIKAGAQALNATQQPAQGQLTPWGAGPNLQMRAPDFTQAKKTAGAAASQFSQAGESAISMLPKPVQNLIPKAKGQKGIMERKSRERLAEAEKSLEFNLAEQDFEKRPDYQNLVNSAALKHSQKQPLTEEEQFAAQIEAKKGFSGFVNEAGQTLWMLATDERTQEEFGRASTLDLPAMIALGGPTGALAKSTTRLGLTALEKGIDLAQMQRFSKAVQRTQDLRKRLDDLAGQPQAAGLARQYQAQIDRLDKLLEAKKSKLLADMTKPLIAGKSAEEAAQFLASEGLIASSLDLGRQMQEGGELDAEAAGRAIALNILTEAVIDAPSLSSIVTNERTGANRDKQTQAALRGSLDLGETPTGTDLQPRLEQAAAIDRTRTRSDLRNAGEIIGTERTAGDNAAQFAENKIVLDPQKTGGIIELNREEAKANGNLNLWESTAKEMGITDPNQKLPFKIKGYADNSGKITLAEGFNRTDYREEHLHTLQSKISKFRKKNIRQQLNPKIAELYGQHERNLQKYFARKGIKQNEISATLDEQIAKDLVRGLDTTGEAANQYFGQIAENAPPMPKELRKALENALGGRENLRMPEGAAKAAAAATQVQPEPEETASEISPTPTPEPAKPKETKAEPTAQPTSEISPDEDADPEGQAIEPTIKGAIAGKGGRAFSEDNTPLPYKWAVIDEGAVTASIGANATNQPRDRSRAASQQQIKDLSQRMNFKLASGSGESVGSGAPVLTKDGVILAGNGRIAGMGLGYESNSKAMAAYKADLQKAAKKYGIDPAQIQGLKRPILVRVTAFDSQDADNVRKWAKTSNQEGAAQYSPAELAKQDAESLNLGEFAADYALNHSANANFVRKFIAQIPAKDRAPLVDSKGQLSADGEKRLSRAVLSKAYGEHPIIAEMIEATDSEGTNILNALKAAAPALAQSGATELAGKALEAVQFLRNANAKSLSPTELAAQTDALKDQDPFVVALAQEFKDNARSYKQLAETLGELADRSTSTAEESQADMMDLMGMAPSQPKGLAQHLAEIQTERENTTIDNIQGDGFRFSLIGMQLANPEQLKELAKAQDLEAKGSSDYAIWTQTGWFRAPWDNRWRFEVSDENFDFESVSSMFGDRLKIKNHPLESYYPRINVEDLPNEDWKGQFNPKYKAITLNLARLQNAFKNTPENLRANIRSTLLHELQHYIQEIENFEGGANGFEDSSKIGYKRSQALLNLYSKAKQIEHKSDDVFDKLDNEHNKIVMAYAKGADKEYKAAIEQINVFDQLFELAKNIQRADSNPLYIRKIGDQLTYEAQRTTNWDQYYRRPRSGMFNRTFKSTAHKHAAYKEFFHNYNRLKFEELQKWAQLNNVQWFPESMRELSAQSGGINTERLKELKKEAFSSLKDFIKKFKLKGRDNARNVINEIERVNKGASVINRLMNKISQDKISVYEAYLRSGGEYEARLVQARAETGAKGYPLDIPSNAKAKFNLDEENKPIPSQSRKNLWQEAADLRFSLEPAQTDSKEFKAWFKDSKVVNDDGSPKVVYHGSGADFNVFDQNKIGQLGRMEGAGFYFAENKKVAQSYADKKLFEVFLSIQKPLDIQSKPFNVNQMAKVLEEAAKIESEQWGESWKDGFLSNFVDTYSAQTLQKAAIQASRDYLQNEVDVGQQIGGVISSGVSAETMNKAINKALGFDSFVSNGYAGTNEEQRAETGKIWVAMFPEQIKSATDNTGAFDAGNPDIRYSLTESPEFKRWFNGSKIVDENGKPLVVYHGTTANFTQFEEEFMGEASGQLDHGRGFYFTPDPDTAASFGEGEGSNLKPVFLSIKNPATNKDLETDEIQDILADDMGFTDAQEYLKEKGFDGIVWTHKRINQKEIITFNPTQIKSATGNMGTFDPENPDIRFSLEPKWHKLDSKERKEYYDPQKIKDLGKYEVFDFDDQKTRTFINEEQERKFLEKYPWSIISGPMDDEKTWFRYGKTPERNRSYNYTEQFAELGVSAYSTPNGSGGASFFADRDIYSGKGKQVGWGSDGEPLIIPTGEWKKYDPEIRFSLEDMRGVPHPDAPKNRVEQGLDWLYQTRAGGYYDSTYQWLIDEMNPLRRIEQQAGILDRQSNPKNDMAAQESAYVENQLRAGKVRDAIETAENLMRPIMKQLKKEGKTIEEAGEFLYAMHAPDYNREMAKINPPRERVQEILEQLKKGEEVETENAAEPWLETLVLDAEAWLQANGEQTEATALEAGGFEVDQKAEQQYLSKWRTQDEIDAGLSGMSTAEAKEIVKAGRQSRGLVALAQAVAELRQSMRDTMLGSGLISAEQAAGLEKYPHYVPLKGWADENIATSMEQAGRAGGGGLGTKGLAVTGADIKRAGGRVTKASNPLGHFLADYQRVHERASRNIIANKVYDLIKQYPQGSWDIWEPQMQRADFARKVKGKPAISKKQAIPTPPSNAIAFKQNGETKYIQIMDKSLERALKTLDENSGSLIEKVLGKYNRFMGALITSYNPEFMITNAIRDAQMVAAVAGVDKGAKVAAQTMLNYAPAIAKMMRAEFKGGTPDASKMGRYWQEFKKAGAQTGYTITDKAPDALKKLESQLETGFKGDALEALRTGFRQIEAANSVIENMGRLSYYAALRDQGYSEQRAAYLAKNLTVNFNRKGLAGKALNSWWLFFNAAIQGNARFLKFTKTPKGLAAIATLAAAGLLVDLGNGLFGPEDEERGIAEWDKKPMQERSTNVIAMRGKDAEFDWRMPAGYGLNVPYTIGQIAGQAIRRQEVSATDAAIQTALAAINGFSPVRWTNNVGQTLSPTFTRIPVDIAVNQNFAGQQITPREMPWDIRPESQKAGKKESQFAKSLAQLMNEATGGNEWQSGWIDQHPAEIDYVVRNSLGGVGAFLSLTAGVPAEIAAGDLAAREVPFVRKTISQRSGYANQQAATDLDKPVRQLGERLENDSTYAKKRPELIKLVEDYEELKKQAAKARKEAKKQGIEQDPADQEKYWAPFLKRAREAGVKP